MTETPYAIIFPHLGISIPDFPKSFSVFGIEIAYYGLLIAIAILLAFLLSIRRAKQTGQKVSDYYDLTIIGILAAIVGARLYYVLFSLDYYLENPGQIFNIRNGGLAIYGGIIGGFLAGFITCKVKKMNYLIVLDTVAPTIALGQAIGRWGNFFNREAFGEYTDCLFAMQIRMDQAAGVITDNIRDHIVTINGVDYIQVHPTFLYESLWCLLLFVLIIIFRKYQQYNGEVLLWYLCGYGLERTFVEGLRTDSLYLWNTRIPVSQLISGILFVVCLVILIVNRMKLNKRKQTD